MIDRMLRRATARPDRVAVVHRDREVTYGALYRWVAAVAEGMRRHGVDEGATVLIALPNCPEFVVAYFATARLGARVYAVDPMASAPELARCLRDSAPRLVVTDGRRAPLLTGAGAAVKTVAVVGGGVPEGGTPFDRLAHPAPADPGSGALPPEAPPYSGDWSITYSSGSTGSPKRICRTQANQVAEARNIAAGAGITAEDVVLCVVPLFHAMGQFCCMITALGAGAELVLLEQVAEDGPKAGQELLFAARCERVLDLVRRRRVTVLPAVPYVLDILADVPAHVPSDLSSVRLCLSGANFLAESVAERFTRRYGLPVRQTYGSSEAGSVSWDTRPVDDASRGSVGRPLEGVEVRIVDPARRPLPVGEVGEIAVRSQAVMTGYVDRPDLNARVLSGGWYYTGDLGTLDEDGRLHVTGRIGLLIDTGGRKVNPLEVEAVLETHPRVAEAAVVAVPAREGDQAVCAVVVAGEPVGEQELLDFCTERMTYYKVPQRVVFRDSLPRSPLGKLLRDRIEVAAEVAAAGAAERAARQARAADPTDRILALVSDITGTPAAEIDPAAPLVTLGLHSLGAIRLRAALEDDLGGSLGLTELLDGTSVADLGRRLADRHDASDRDGTVAGAPARQPTRQGAQGA